MAAPTERTHFRLSISCPAALTDRLEALAFSHAPWGWSQEEDDSRTHIRLHFPALSDARNLRDIVACALPGCEFQIAEEQDKEWSEAWKTFFTPIRVRDAFVVQPPWEPKTLQDPAKTIVIHPAMAFGTGHHATTLLCLEALCDLLEDRTLPPGRTFLDLGCGSGILAIACALSGLNGLGLDIDPVAVDNATLNIAANHVEQMVTVRCGSLETLPPGARFDLVLANILAEPLTDMASELARLIAPSGCLVLSGLLTVQADSVVRAYTAAGLRPPRLRTSGEWTSLVWTDGGGRK